MRFHADVTTNMLLLVELSNILLLLVALVGPCLTNTTSVH